MNTIKFKLNEGWEITNINKWTAFYKYPFKIDKTDEGTYMTIEVPEDYTLYDAFMLGKATGLLQGNFLYNY